MKEGQVIKLFGSECELFDFYNIDNVAYIQIQGDKIFFSKLLEKSKLINNTFNKYLDFITSTSKNIEVENIQVFLNIEVVLTGIGPFKGKTTSKLDMPDYTNFEDIDIEHKTTEVEITLSYKENGNEKYDAFKVTIKKFDAEKDNEEYINLLTEIIIKTGLYDEIYKKLLSFLEKEPPYMFPQN